MSASAIRPLYISNPYLSQIPLSSPSRNPSSHNVEEFFPKEILEAVGGLQALNAWEKVVTPVKYLDRESKEQGFATHYQHLQSYQLNYGDSLKPIFRWGLSTEEVPFIEVFIPKHSPLLVFHKRPFIGWSKEGKHFTEWYKAGMVARSVKEDVKKFWEKIDLDAWCTKESYENFGSWRKSFTDMNEWGLKYEDTSLSLTYQPIYLEVLDWLAKNKVASAEKYLSQKLYLWPSVQQEEL